MIDIIVTTGVLGFKVLSYQVLVCVIGYIFYCLALIFSAYVGHELNNILDLIYSDIGMRLEKFLFVFQKIVSEHILCFINAIQLRVILRQIIIAPFYQVSEGVKIEKQNIPPSKDALHPL